MEKTSAKKTVKKRSKAKSHAKKKTIRKKTTKRKTILKKAVKKVLKKPGKKISSEIIRVPTGISKVDKMIGSGFIKNTTNLLVGGSGSGKTVFATQFLIGGMKKGEKCLYVTFEEKKERFYNNMRQFGWDLEEYEKKGLFIFLEYTPEKVKAMLEEGGGTVESIILKNKITRMVIDSITSFDLLFERELEKREAALLLFHMISKWNCTSLLTIERRPVKEEKIDTGTLEFEADSIILLYFLRSKGERKRYIEILKMRGTAHSKKIYRFFVDKSGINVKNTVSTLGS